MPKKTPECRHNSLGDYVGPWTVTISYDDAADVITVAAIKQGTRWTKTKSWRLVYAPDELEDALSDLERIARTAGARRLF